MSLVRPRFPASQRDYDRIATAIRQIGDGRLTGTMALTAVPSAGLWAAGDVVRNSAPAKVTGGTFNYVTYGWICTVAGEPGTWEELRIPCA